MERFTQLDNLLTKYTIYKGKLTNVSLKVLSALKLDKLIILDFFSFLQFFIQAGFKTGTVIFHAT